MYKIIGGDQKEYGPVTAEQMRQWIAEGRVSGQTRVLPEGATEWKTVGELPEFADTAAATPPPLSAAPASAAPPGLGAEVFTRDYDLDIGRCVGDGWNLMKNNFGLIFGGAAIFMLIEAGMGGMAQIPILGILVSLASLVVTGPLTGGVCYFFLKNIRRQPAEIGDIFTGFRRAFGQLVLGYLVLVILVFLSALPGLVIVAVPVFLMVRQNAAEAGLIFIAALGFLVAIVPAIYLSVSWIFSLPLIIDKRMEFWPAMSASRRMVGKHWWLVFGLVVICGLIRLAGVLACCVGLFISVPVEMGAKMYAYESIFSPPSRTT